MPVVVTGTTQVHGMRGCISVQFSVAGRQGLAPAPALSFGARCPCLWRRFGVDQVSILLCCAVGSWFIFMHCACKLDLYIWAGHINCALWYTPQHSHQAGISPAALRRRGMSRPSTTFHQQLATYLAAGCPLCCDVGVPVVEAWRPGAGVFLRYEHL